MPAHPAGLPVWMQRYISQTYFSESPWQSILDCYAAQETGQGERCGPVSSVSVAQIFKLIFKIKKCIKIETNQLKPKNMDAHTFSSPEK